MKRLSIISAAAAMTVAGLAGCAGKTTNYFQTPVGRIYSEPSQYSGESTVFRTDDQGNLVEAGYVNRLTGKVVVSYWADSEKGIPKNLKADFEKIQQE